MNISELQPRVFYRGEIWQVKEIDFNSKSIWIENAGTSNRSRVIFEEHETFKIDRPVGIITDRHGKEVMAFEKDIIRAFSYIDEEEPENNSFDDSVITWCGADEYFAFDAIPREDVDCNYLSYILSDSEIKGVEIIGNVHENPELAPEGWKNGNDSQ